MGKVVIEVENMQKGFGERILIDDMRLKMNEGGIVGVIGKKGEGKQKILKMMKGKEKKDKGQVRIGEKVNI